MDFCRIELDDIAQINYNESKNADFLKTLFLSNRYVYVRNESHRLLGIITPTSFQNHFSVGKHVNYSFRYAIDCELGGGGELKLQQRLLRKHDAKRFLCFQNMGNYYTFLENQRTSLTPLILIGIYVISASLWNI